MSQLVPINLSLHHKQGVALQSEATELFYGGAAGGGKSHLMRVAAILWCASIPGLQVYLFRRIRDDLIKNHVEGPKGFRAMLSPWFPMKFARIVDDEIRFWNGSRIYLCHCKDAKDVYKYQGAEIHVLIIDELTHFLEDMYRFLRNRVRMVGLNLPEQYVGKFPRILCGANPGNIGHLFVKRTFVEGVTPFDIRQMPVDEGGMRRQFIPAVLEDNPSMATDDPGYEARLRGLGSKQLVEAMRWGNWEVIEGAFFDCWDARRHIVRPFEIPKGWMRFCSADWGSAKPFSIGWWAVASDQFTADIHDHPGQIIIPRGCMVRYREWYGALSPDVGLKLHAEKVADGIVSRETKGEVSYRVMDPAAFAENGGRSIAARMGDKGVHWRPADNTRVAGRGAMNGWDQMRARLMGDDDENPMLVTFSTCADSIRTVPALQHDKNRAEDVDTNGEDHAGDEWRYACNSRPWVRKPETKVVRPKDDYTRARDGEAKDAWKVAT
jgi:Terminase large subunit, T4likevirus-type, N-terminal